MTATLNGVAPLPHLGVIRVQGEEAAKFLHAQLTQDFALLGSQEARLAAFCTAKGRMLASFIGFKRAPDDILLLTPRDVLPAALKRLSMFLLRTKAKLTDASGEFDVYGLAGEPLERVEGGPRQPWMKADIGAAALVQLYPTEVQPRALWIAPHGDAPPAGAPLTPELWQWSDVRSGVALVTPPVVEAFVPQMLNYESVGGVNFKKGCYPGQEVVARSQFRGTLKRRAFIVHAPQALSAGQEVFHESDREQPAGLVAQAAFAPTGGCDAIVSMQISADDGGSLTAGGPDGVPLELLPLPYLLLADV